MPQGQTTEEDLNKDAKDGLDYYISSQVRLPTVEGQCTLTLNEKRPIMRYAVMQIFKLIILRLILFYTVWINLQ